jgi:hypothetical protein
MALPVFVLGGPIIWLIWPYAQIEHLPLSDSLAMFGLQGKPWIAFIIYYSLVNPWLEEWFWRGYMSDTSRCGAWSDLLYAGYHALVLGSFVTWPWILFALVVLTFAGTVWRLLAKRCDGLLIPVLGHMIADVTVIGAAWVLGNG